MKDDRIILPAKYTSKSVLYPDLMFLPSWCTIIGMIKSHKAFWFCSLRLPPNGWKKWWKKIQDFLLQERGKNASVCIKSIVSCCVFCVPVCDYSFLEWVGKVTLKKTVPFVGKHEAVWRRSQRKCWSRGWNAYCTYIILLTLILTRSRTILHGKVVTSCDHHHWQPNPYNSLSTTPSHPQLITSKVDTLIYDDHETALYL